jgi:Carboxypeptidase regulatory-like domain
MKPELKITTISATIELLRATLLALLLAISSYAQGEASIAGTVTDSSGASVAGATITVRNLENNLIRRTSTDVAGR